MPGGKFIPVQDSSDPQNAGKRRDRDETQPDGMPILGQDHPGKEIGPTQVGGAQHHSAHARFNRPGEQLPGVIRQQVKHHKGHHQYRHHDPCQNLGGQQHPIRFDLI